MANYELFLLIHQLAVGAWIGCVLTESVFEITIGRKGKAEQVVLSQLHSRIDVFVEIPLMLAVVVSGLGLLVSVDYSNSLAVKLVFAALALITNFWCYLIIRRRSQEISQNNWQGFEGFNLKLRCIGSLIPLGIIPAVIIATVFQ